MATTDVPSALDGRIHHAVITSFVERGFPPTDAEVADELGAAVDEVRASLRRLHDGHGLVLHPDSHAIWIAHPFSASPTAVWVEAGARGWWAPCLWCASGIVALAAPTATIHVRFGGECDEARIAIANATADAEVVVHFAMSPRTAWNNVVHWCASVLPFRNPAEVDAWCERHRFVRGAIVPLAQALELGRAWYGRHLDREWRKWTVAEAQAIFSRVGLTGEFWQLPVSDRTF